MNPQDRYILISADCHAGGNHEMYREYLEKRYLDDFDRWRGRYANPFKDLTAALVFQGFSATVTGVTGTTDGVLTPSAWAVLSRRSAAWRPTSHSTILIASDER